MSGRSWGIELWNQSENLLKHCTDQIATTDTYFRLFTEVQRLQYEYGKRLRKTVAGFQRKKTSSPDELSYTTSFDQIVQSLSTLGSIFEATSKDLEENVVKTFKQAYDNERKEMDTRRNDLLRLNQNLDQLRKQLDVTWQKYVAAFKDQQRAHENWLRGEKELPSPRAEQLRDLFLQKQHALGQLKAHYAAELNKYNSGLRQYYNKGIVQCLEELSLQSRCRTERTKELLEKMTKINEDTCAKFSDCVRSMQSTVATIDSVKDDELVINHFKTGEFAPVDLPFLDLEHCPASVLEGSNHTLGSFMLGINPSDACTQLPGSTAPAGSTGMLSSFKRGAAAKGSAGDYPTLRSPFVCDISTRSLKETDFTIIQLAERLRDLSNQMKWTESELEGTRRLLEAYRENSSLGSPQTVEPKVIMLQRRISSLQDGVKRLQSRYDQLGGESRLIDARKQLLKLQSSQTEPGPGVPLSSMPTTNADSDNSFDSGESDTETKPTGASLPSSATNTGAQSANYVGHATMKYEYEGNGSLCLAAKPGDFFYVTQFDTDGSGWTSVITQDGSRSGLVPTGYIELTKY